MRSYQIVKMREMDDVMKITHNNNITMVIIRGVSLLRGRESKPQAISKATGGNDVSIESPVPPEPSPITPGPVNQSHQLTEVEETEEDKAERSSQEKDGI